MAFASSLTELQLQATCPICSDYLRDAVTLDCGHNFCDSCVQERWAYLQDIFPCPVCFHHCPGGATKRNTQLSYIVDIMKQLPTGRSKRKRQEEEPLCEKHNEVLDLFCEEDSELLCPQCRASSDHQGHHLMPTGRAIVNQRKKLKTYMELLKKQINDAKMVYEDQVREGTEARFQIENCKGQLKPEFEKFKFNLKRENISMSSSLLTSEIIMEDKLTQNKNSISDHRKTLKNLLDELTKKCLQTDQNLLRSIKSTDLQYGDLPPPVVLTYEIRRESLTLPPHYIGLNKIVSTFQENLTLDLETAHANLIVSNDRKRVAFGIRPMNFVGNFQHRIPFPAVLSCESFTEGRHFWQVEVKGTGELSLGLCKENFREKIPVSSISDNDFWQFKLTLRPFLDTEQEEQNKRFGVFLDYELGELSFYNLKSKFFLHKITGTFPERVIPFFAFGPSSDSLMLSLVMEQ
ncbi:tripartite motif-containing protein 75-like [Sorex araneus]|uniref:tripartite motif-containing protein 75-like n=1 Tax=Sorex araneus TaxID=42254 RepID=UPI0024335F4A|nr:tripartite motif-containing protein 75-like [Sorex araneus]